MRKLTAVVWMLLLICACSGALAAGVTLRTFTPFADIDVAAQSYMDMLTVWEEESGNMVEDYSGLTDEAWMKNLREMVKSGEADVVIVPRGSGLTHEELVTVQELAEAVPDLGLRSFTAMKEDDGSVLLSPLRVSFEALYVNRDVLEAKGLAVPKTYEELLTLCAALSAQGITPVSNALGDWAEIALDCAALASSSDGAFGSAQSLDGAKEMLSALHAVGAFGSDTLTGSDMDAMQAFIDGRAAMRLDSDMLANMIPSDRLNSVIVIPMPRRTGEESGVLCGMPGFGIGVTRACWADDARCEAAISLLRTLLQKENRQSLAVGIGGALGESIDQMLLEAADCSGILYDQLGDGFDAWAQSVIESLK